MKPDKARGVEEMILKAAQRGALSEKARFLPCHRHSSPARLCRHALALHRLSLTHVCLVQMSEEQLVGMLERINESNPQKTKITMQRRRAFDDD